VFISNRREHSVTLRGFAVFFTTDWQSARREAS